MGRSLGMGPRKSGQRKIVVENGERELIWRNEEIGGDLSIVPVEISGDGRLWRRRTFIKLKRIKRNFVWLREK